MKIIDRQDLLPKRPGFGDLERAIKAAIAVAEKEQSHIRFMWQTGTSVEVIVAEDSDATLILNTIFVTNHTFQSADRTPTPKVGPYPAKLVFDVTKAKLHKPRPRPADEAHLSERNPVKAYQITEQGWAVSRSKLRGGRLEQIRDWYVWPGDWYTTDMVTREIDVVTDEQFRMGHIV